MFYLLKIKDVFRKNLIPIIMITVIVPVLFLSFYFLFPGSYEASLKIRLKADNPSLVENGDYGKVLAQNLQSESIFGQETINYLAGNLRIEEVSESRFKLILSDSRSSRLTKNIQNLLKGLRDRAGYLTSKEIQSEQENLKKQIMEDTEKKKALEDYFQSLDQKELEDAKRYWEDKMAALTEPISKKTRQLELIQSKLAEIETNENNKSKNIFEEKANALRKELDTLNSQKKEIEENYNKALKAYNDISKTVEDIVLLEKSLDKNSKRIEALTLASSTEDKYIKVPYYYQILILEPHLKPLKIYASNKIQKTLIWGFIFSAIIIFLLTIYNLFINPVISSAPELERSSKLPVIGAISEVRKNS
jgi:hypothetical protein